MALENADALSDPFPLSSTLERVPDSSPIQVSLDTQYESGIPPARLRREPNLEAGVERLETALAEVGRTEANLGLLVRGLRQLSQSALSAREAHTEVLHELDELRSELTRRDAEEQSARYRTSQIEQVLSLVRHESAREREFLIEQQDSFLAEILTDHERQVSELRRQLERRPESEVIAELTLQRDQAREYAARCERERDQAWHELATGENTPAVTIRRPTLPPPPPVGGSSSSTSGAQAIASIALRAVQVPAIGAGYALSGDEVIE